MMTKEDLDKAHAIADDIIARATGNTHAAVVAGIALAFAGAAHLAGCGPDAALALFRHYYQRIDKAQQEDNAKRFVAETMAELQRR